MGIRVRYIAVHSARIWQTCVCSFFFPHEILPFDSEFITLTHLASARWLASATNCRRTSRKLIGEMCSWRNNGYRPPNEHKPWRTKPAQTVRKDQIADIMHLDACRGLNLTSNLFLWCRLWEREREKAHDEKNNYERCQSKLFVVIGQTMKYHFHGHKLSIWNTTRPITSRMVGPIVETASTNLVVFGNEYSGVINTGNDNKRKKKEEPNLHFDLFFFFSKPLGWHSSIQAVWV